MSKENNSNSKQEAFESSYRIFIDTIKMLSEEADVTCTQMGNYNVAWELVDDAKSDGEFVLSSRKLASNQVEAINKFLDALGEVPKEILVAATSAEDNIIAMKNSCWNPVRKQAKDLIQILEPATKKNTAFFKSS